MSSQAVDLIEQVGLILRKLKRTPIYELTIEDLQYVPITYLIDDVCSGDLKLVWEKLPIRYRSSNYLQKKLPCLRHHNKSRTHVEGSPPPISKCFECVDEELMKGFKTICQRKTAL